MSTSTTNSRPRPTRTTRGAWDARLVCNVRHLQYDFSTRMGKLWFPLNNCCDMGAAIKLFEAIDPRVKRIETIAGDFRDTVYVRCRKEWYVFPGPTNQRVE